MARKAAIVPKDRPATIYIRNVPAGVKKAFVETAEALGYRPRELFEIMVNKLSTPVKGKK